jgi:hypothetical protein
MRWKPFGKMCIRKAADELVCRKCHELLPLGTLDPVVLVFEPDAHRVSCDQAAIGDGDAMRVAREVRENGFGSAEWLLRIDQPFRSPERDEEGGERIDISERCVRAEELEVGQPRGPRSTSARPGVGTVVTARGRPRRSSVDRRSTSRYPLTARRPARSCARAGDASLPNPRCAARRLCRSVRLGVLDRPRS